MRNVKWVSLSDAERGQLVAMWVLAADHDGVIPASPEVIQKLCFMSKPPKINKFIKLGFIENGWRHDGVTMASNGSQSDAPKAKAETEAETEEDTPNGVSCPEPEKAPASEPPPVMSIPLIKRDGEFHIREPDLAEWQDTFPRVDVPVALKRIRQWSVDNPDKRKTKKGIRKHITGWLAKAQDKGEFKKESGGTQDDAFRRVREKYEKAGRLV